MGKKTGNYERCIQQASQFLDVAEYCKSQNSMPSKLIFPLFVNAALACELYLKAIMIAESGNNSFHSGHTLSSLFDKVSVEAQESIRQNYMRKGIHISLDDMLLRYGDAFVKWRYCFEQGAEGNSFGIIGFAYSLKEYINQPKEPH